MIKICKQSIVLTACIYFSLPTLVISQTQNQARKHLEAISQPNAQVSVDKFSVCSQYGCKKVESLSLTKKEWLELTNDFNVAVNSPYYERMLIAIYIGKMEKIVGRHTNTQFDKGGTFPLFFKIKNVTSNQMDCIDESANTLTYLRILKSEGMLKMHEVIGLVTRGGIFAGYPHTAVLITEKISKEKYVIDSWFLDNGRPAEIVPYSEWKAGWKP